jgi:hypothetical protein
MHNVTVFVCRYLFSDNRQLATRPSAPPGELLACCSLCCTEGRPCLISIKNSSLSFLEFKSSRIATLLCWYSETLSVVPVHSSTHSVSVHKALQTHRFSTFSFRRYLMTIFCQHVTCSLESRGRLFL